MNSRRPRIALALAALAGAELAAAVLAALVQGLGFSDAIESYMLTNSLMGAVFGPGVARRVLGDFSSPPETPQEPFPELSPREREVLDLIAAGLPNSAIAARLGLADKTVGNYISAVFAKLQVATRAKAIIRARDAGLGGGGQSV